MLKRVFLFSIISLNVFITKAQSFPDKIDVSKVENIIRDFTRLTFNRQNIDSIIKLCSFPFYMNELRTKKVYNSADELKAELNQTFKNEKNDPFIYKIDTLFKSDSCINTYLKNESFICFKIIIHMPYVGESNEGSFFKAIFFMERKLPYRIMAIERYE